MGTANLPPGFDFTDPDIYADRLPVQELAELRANAALALDPQPT
jgi:cholest-4-en-3-one 26-monooxygenase